MWHSQSFEEVVRQLDSDIGKGLTEKEVLEREKKFGKNLLPQEKPVSRLKIFFEQFKSPLIYILIFAGFITLFFREWADTVVIFGAVFLNSIVGYFQENKANNSLRELKKIVKIKAQVLREENLIEIDSENLVQGDIIALTSGSKVPADGRLVEAHNLKINEAPLTGEWISAEKIIEVLPEDTALADRDNMVYMGSTVEDGKGRVVVTAIGENSEIGHVASLIKEAKEQKTPLQKKIANLSKTIGIVVGFIAFFIFIEGVFKGKEFLEMFITSVAVAVAAIPEGLPVAMTIILALGMQRILKRKGLVRKLIAAETLGSTSIIATDKTLTLTQGKMEVTETVTMGAKIQGSEDKDWADLFKEKNEKDQMLLMKIATVTNEAFVENPEDLYPLWRMRGRPTDRALLLAGVEVGFKKWELAEEYSRLDEIPFNPQNKFIATLHQEGQEELLYVSGAPEKIISLSKIDKDDLPKLNQDLEDLTSRGLRVVGAAYKEISNFSVPNFKLEEEINNLNFVGFIGLKDPLREEAKEVIQICKKAGMKPIIVTGDHLLTAKAIGDELGLKTGKENIIEGKDLDEMSDEEFQERIKDIEIYARVEPKHKLKIVDFWQRKGEVVAMTGDGINDAPALKKADIGVSLGSGTDIAKEVSDLVLLTDNFNIIVAAVEEGRAIIDNIRKVITYLLSDSFAEIILVGVSILLGWPLPVTAVQILWVNLIEDGLPGIALAFEPKEKDVLQRKPEGKEARLLNREMRAIIFIIGILTSFILLGLLWWLLRQGQSLQYVRTMIFAGLGMNSLFYIFSCKSLRRNIWHINPFSNKFLVFSVLSGFLMLILGVHLSVFQTLLKTVSLGFQDWLIIFVLGIMNIILIEATKYYFIVKHQTEK